MTPPPYQVAHPLLSMPALPRQTRLALAFVVVSALIFVSLAPFAQLKLQPIAAFIPIYQSALVINDLLTSAAIFGLVRATGSRRLLWLGCAYLFTALMTVAHMLTFPGLFAQGGLLGAGMHSTAWLYVFWHGGFPLCVLAYALIPEKQVGRSAVLSGIGCSIAAAVALTLLATKGESLLLPIFENGRYSVYQPFILATSWISTAVALLVLLRKKTKFAIDVWLLVVLATWIFEIALAAILNAGRFDLGFYAGRVYGLISSITVLYMLLLDSTLLHQRLASASAQAAAHRERAAAQQMLDAVVSQLPAGIIVMQGSSNDLLINQHAASILSAAREDNAAGAAMSAAGLSMISPTIRPVREFIEKVARGESVVDQEFQISKDGEMRHISVSGRPVLATANAMLGSVIVLTDITDSRRAEQVLHLALTRMRYLVENTPLAVIEWDASSVITSWSARATALFGWSEQDMVGTRLQSAPIMHEDERSKIDELVFQVADPTTTYVQTNILLRTKQGAVKHFEWYTSVLHDADGNVLTVFSLILDVTERMQAIAQLQIADRRKDMQLVTIAHELRNPLSPISHAAMLIRGKQLPAEKLSWAGELITRQATHMARLLDDLLDVTRISTGKIKLDVTRFDLVPAIHDAIEMSLPLLVRCGHTFSSRLPDEKIFVQGDAMRLVQLFSNLLNNAGKYTEAGGHIEIALEQHGGFVEIQVIDNGIGIEPSMLTQIFEPFVQVDRASHLARGGLGIGLALAKGITELHNGTISVASDGNGRGSVFSVLLPRSSQETPVAENKGEAPRLCRLDKVVLVADDDVDGADSLAHMLRSIGARVEVAYDGAAALDIITRGKVDIAILDIRMPMISGRDLAERLSLLRPRPHLIALSSLGGEHEMAANLRSGFDSHHTKPMRPEKMLEEIGKLI